MGSCIETDGTVSRGVVTKPETAQSSDAPSSSKLSDSSPADSVSETTRGGPSTERSHRRRRIGPRREAAKADTRAALIDAAMASFAEEGLDNPSLDAICERAGYTRGAFYVHFQDREDLIRAVSERYLGALVQSVTEYDESPEALLNLISRLMSTTETPSQVPAHQFLHACGRSDTLRELYLNTLRVVSEHVCDATQLSQARAAVRGDIDPKQLTWLLIALATGLQALNETGAPVDAKGSAQLLAQLLRR